MGFKVQGVSCSTAYGILVPWLGIESASCIGRRILNQWTTRETPGIFFFLKTISLFASWKTQVYNYIKDWGEQWSISPIAAKSQRQRCLQFLNLAGPSLVALGNALLGEWWGKSATCSTISLSLASNQKGLRLKPAPPLINCETTRKWCNASFSFHHCKPETPFTSDCSEG